MLRRLLCESLGVLVAAVFLAGPAAGGETSAFLRKYPVAARPGYPGNLTRFPTTPQGRSPYYAVNVPAYPWLGHGMTVPTYNWGYFGAQYRPLVMTQHDYHGKCQQWSFRPGD
jgi:hypothetical protein